MSDTPPLNNPEWLRAGIERSLKTQIEQEFDAQVQKAIARCETLKGEIVAGIMVDLMKQADFQMMQDRIVITIRKP